MSTPHLWIPSMGPVDDLFAQRRTHAGTQPRFRRGLADLFRRRERTQELIDRHSRRCPLCGSGLYLKNIPWAHETLVFCKDCGASKILPLEMTEATALGDGHRARDSQHKGRRVILTGV